MFDILKTVQVPVRSLTSESVAAGRPEEVQETLSQAPRSPRSHAGCARNPLVVPQALCFCWRVGLAVVAWSQAIAAQCGIAL